MTLPSFVASSDFKLPLLDLEQLLIPKVWGQTFDPQS
jgi:hypothetical protein